MIIIIKGDSSMGNVITIGKRVIDNSNVELGSIT